ncbi:MAG: hypothetical protein JW874_06400 [Spirochaetales bacterium]|nr:hypothetical protein [Spirochaetales bacterium]
MGINRKILRISLAVGLAVLAVFYFIAVQYSFTQMEGTWVAFIRNDKIRKISATPGFKLIVPGEEVFNLPKTTLVAEVPPARYFVDGSAVMAGFLISWQLVDPQAYLETIVSVDKTDSMIIESVTDILRDRLVRGDGLSRDDFFALAGSLPGQLNDSRTVKDSGIHIESVMISDFSPAADDGGLENNASESNPLYGEKLRILRSVGRQWERDTN